MVAFTEGFSAAALAVALAAPEFGATSHDGTHRTKANLIGKPTIMWFFPLAGTPGWTREGCGYRDRQSEFEALGIQIVAVSFSDPSTTHEWVIDQQFQFEIWTDDDKTLALHYGAVGSSWSPFPSRITKMLDENGRLMLEYTDISVSTHPGQVLEDCQAIFGNEAASMPQ